MKKPSPADSAMLDWIALYATEINGPHAEKTAQIEGKTMSDIPRTEAAIDAPMDGPHGLDIVKRLTALCAQLETENAELKAENLELQTRWENHE